MKEVYEFSVPGRTELGGNHTDHQRGCILAGAVDLYATAKVSLNGENVIRIKSRGYPLVEISLDQLEARREEVDSTAALVRGVAAAFAKRGAALKGLDAEIVSHIPVGTGLSSSAAFEVLLCKICNGLFMEKPLTPLQLAQIGQWVENTYFGKPCGLMDQLAVSYGGVIFADFSDPEAPLVERIPFDFSACGHALCLIATGGDHSALTGEYAAITEELRAVCDYFGKTHLRQVEETAFWAELPQLRKKVSDRSILRAMHVYQENKRVMAQVEKLLNGDFEGFLALCRESGRSSWMYLQNIYPSGIAEQPMALTLAVCDQLLQGRGAYRVHGGGFAGTVQAFVPLDMLETFQTEIEKVVGADSCRVLSIV